MRVLYLTHRVPYAPNRGDRIRAFHTLQYLRGQGVPVHVVALAHDAEEASRGPALADFVTSYDIVRLPRIRNALRAAPSLAGPAPLTHLLLDSPMMRAVLENCRATFNPQRVLAYCSGMARFAMAPPLEGLPFVLDMVDVDSLKWASLALERHGPHRWIYQREARVLRRFEVKAMRAARATLVVSEREREALLELEAGIDPIVLPNGVDTDGFRPSSPASDRPEVVFVGVFSYEPNERAARWLIAKIWPLVVQRRPDAHLTLVGSGPSDQLRRLASRHQVHVTGAVADVRPYLWRAALGVAPLFTARGVQNKVLEAVAAGLPTVVTPSVHAGLPHEVRPACRQADSAAAFAAAIADLLDLPASARRAVAASADVGALTWSARLAPLKALLEC